MAEDTPRSIPSPRQEGQGRSPRQGDNREPGGFRIRLSDNEMQAARALQEALGLRSTVAVLASRFAPWPSSSKRASWMTW